MSAARGGPTGALTRREAEVLELVSRRLTNAEIAEELVVSVRTVETHVSSLLRKLQVADRRALARRAAEEARSPHRQHRALPVPLTSFIGRTAELAGLTSAIRQHRLVTTTGPGGIGKTRLALEAAASMNGEVVVVDLVEVIDTTTLVDVFADALEVAEATSAERERALLAAVAERECLVIVDNCEHLVEPVARLLERLLAAGPKLRVVATSRVRLMLPAETVVPVPGMSIGDLADPGDAPALFETRMLAAGGAPPTDDVERAMIIQICAALDGIALAIELAAARVPSLGLDGLLAALDGPLAVLASSTRSDERHRSLRAAIAWSYDLLEPRDQAILQAASVFAGPATIGAVCAVAGVDRPEALEGLAHLVDVSLASRYGTPTRYRILQTIRQFSAEASEATGELSTLRAAHRAWCLEALVDVEARAPGDEIWCDEVDTVLPEARMAMGWLPDGTAGAIDEAVRFADALAAVEFQRGHPLESSRRYAQAAAWSAGIDRHDRLVSAAWAAAVGNVGAEAVALFEEAADAAASIDDGGTEAVDLAYAATILRRFSGLVGYAVPADRPDALIERALRVTDGSPRARATLAVAEAWTSDSGTRSPEAAAEALAVAREVGDLLALNSALDQEITIAIEADDIARALDAVAERERRFDGTKVDTAVGFEMYDSRRMAHHVAIAAGQLRDARRLAEEASRLPWFREERHLCLGRHLELDLLTGDPHEEHAEAFEHDWVRSGRPVASNLAVGTYAAATRFGMSGDRERREHWVAITRAVMPPNRRYLEVTDGFAAVFDAMLALHLDDPYGALERMTLRADAPGAWTRSNQRVWRPLYAALRAEASVLADHPDAPARVDAATACSADHPIASLITTRARMLHDRRLDEVRTLARRFVEAGSPYQADRCSTVVNGFEEVRLGADDRDRDHGP